MTPELVLSAMVALIPPGRSAYSAVPVVEGAVCDSSHSKGCRIETAKEGLERYRTIAKAVAEVAGDNKRIAAELLGVIYHESGFRRDVHAGVGKDAKGDKGCSHGIAQRNICEGRTRRGWTGDDLTGLDLDSTRRSVVTAADGLRRAGRYCSWHAGDPSLACKVSVFGSGKISLRRTKPVLRRVATIGRAAALLRRRD